MADTIIVKVDLQDGQALAKLQNIDQLTKALNGRTVNLRVAGGGGVEMQRFAQGVQTVNNPTNGLGKTTKLIAESGKYAGKTVKQVTQYSDALGNTTKVIEEFDKKQGKLKHTFTQNSSDMGKQSKYMREATKAYEDYTASTIKAQRAVNTPMQDRIDNMLGIGRKTDWSVIRNNFANQAQLQKDIARESRTWERDRVGTSGWQFDEEIKQRKEKSPRFAQMLEGDLKERENYAKEKEKLEKRARGKSPREKHPLLGDSIGAIALKMGAWQIMGAAVSGVIRSFTEAVGTMKQVDTELTNIQKVTNMSKAEIDALGDSAYSTASKYGVAADEYLQNIGVFAKAGYKEQSDELGELAIKTQLVGDVTAEMASRFILSTDAAYQMGGSVNKLSVVLDKANAIENNYATSIQKIAEGMPLVASVASTAHMTIDQTIAALGTITATTQESGTMAARALRALILNILGDTETEIAEGVAWTEGEIKSLNDVMWQYSRTAMEAAAASGEVVNPMEAIAGLSKAFKEGALTEAELVKITSDLGGKLRTNQLLALVKNFDMFNDMLGTMAVSAGSADKEVETMLSSWERKSQVLSNTWTEFLTNFVDTDFVKGAMDGLTGLVSGLNDLLKDATDKATEHADEVKNAYEDMYGAGSRYEYLIANQEKLNELEREELTILEAKKPYEQQKITDSEREKWQAWQNEFGTGKNTYDVWGYDSEGVYGRLDADVVNLERMSAEINDANEAFADTKNAVAYEEAIGNIVGKWADYVESSKDAKEAGVEISDSQEQMIDIFDALTRSLGRDEQNLTKYVDALAGFYMAQGKTKDAAYKQSAADFADLRASIEEIPEEHTTEIEADTAQANANIEATKTNIAGVQGKVVYIDVITRYSTEGEGGGFASGTDNAPGGPAMVNELGPEAIITHGTAFIAGGGKPTVTNLPKGAIVLTAAETKRALSGGELKPFASAYAAGRPIQKYISEQQYSRGPELSPYAQKIHNKVMAELTHGHDPSLWDEEEIVIDVAKPKDKSKGNSGKWNSGGGGYGGSGGSAAPAPPNFEELEKALDETLKNLEAQAELAENEGRFVDAMKIYGKAQGKIQELLDRYRAAGYSPDSDEILTLANKGYDYADKEFSDRDKLQKDLIDALEDLNKTQKDANDLAEKEKAVEDAKKELASAQQQRTVRIYNPVTDQWEWIADAKDIQSAQERLKDAEESLKDEQISQELDKIENSKWEDIGGIKPGSALADLINSGTEEQKQAIANALGILSGGVDYSNSSAGKTPYNQGNDSHDTNYNFPGGIVISESEAGNITLKELADKLSGLSMTNGERGFE